VRLMLIGKNGQIGWELERALAPLGELAALDSRQLNLTDFGAVRRLVREYRPEIIVNAAAYTAVDRAEEEKEIAMAINGDAPGILAEEALRAGALIVHYSTDYVFDGKKGSPYLEDDSPNPLSVYGCSKLAGEKAIRNTGAAYLIFRTSWVYGLRGSNFLLTILRLAGEKEELNVVNDQFGTPNWCRVVAEVTARAISRIGHDGELKGRLSGIYNLSASGKTSWYEFAAAILAADPRKDEKICRRVNPIDTSRYPAAARRPGYSVLDNSKIQTAFGVTLKDWGSYLQDLFEQQSSSL